MRRLGYDLTFKLIRGSLSYAVFFGVYEHVQTHPALDGLRRLERLRYWFELDKDKRLRPPSATSPPATTGAPAASAATALLAAGDDDGDAARVTSKTIRMPSTIVPEATEECPRVAPEVLRQEKLRALLDRDLHGVRNFLFNEIVSKLLDEDDTSQVLKDKLMRKVDSSLDGAAALDSIAHAVDEPAWMRILRTGLAGTRRTPPPTPPAASAR